MGAGLGLGMGFGMAKEMAGQMGQQTPDAAGPGEKLTPDQLKENRAQLKQLLDEGLITQADFDEKKRDLLARL